VGISQWSLPERFKQIQKLESELKKAEVKSKKNRSAKAWTKQQERQLLADQDAIFELRHRLTLKRTEYLAQKEISPDYIEGVS
jgi:hypothetical protein